MTSDVGVMVQCYGHLLLIQKNTVGFPARISGGPVILPPRDLTSFPGLCWYHAHDAHIYLQANAHKQKINNVLNGL